MPKKPPEIEPLSKVEQVLADAQSADEVICICIREGEIEVNSTMEYAPDILWALEHAKIHCLELGDDFTEQ
jgi:hypothetical protein